LTQLEEFKARGSRAWGFGPFERMAETLVDIHDELVRKLAPVPGERWLDVATGTGAVAVRAARAGSEVTGSDFAPALIETAKSLAAEAGLSIRFEIADAERLPQEDGCCDVVSSSFGTMFAPDHQAVARELTRVTRPGGRLGLTAWRPEGRVGDMFRLFGEFGPPLPPEAGSPLAWGDEDYVGSLLGDGFELEFATGDSPHREASAEAVWELMSTSLGPVTALAHSLEPDRREEFRRAFIEFFQRDRVDGGIVSPRPYLLVLGRRS